MKKIYKNAKKRKGVTLIEVIVTMVIIGIILGIAVPNYSSYTNKAMEASRDQTASRIMATVKDSALYARSNGGNLDIDLINRNLVDVKVAWTEDTVYNASDKNRVFRAEAAPNEASDTWGVSIDWKIDSFRTSIQVVAPDGTTKSKWEENWPPAADTP